MNRGPHDYESSEPINQLLARANNIHIKNNPYLGFSATYVRII
ncbi:hypothetical protein BOVAB4_4469 [Bacteroides ovatus]|nr:hypothetical protein BOVAB4_4469 [Bacteroides ovatus]